MSVVLVRNGSYRNVPIINTKFTLVKGFQQGKKGNYITVRNDGIFPIAIDNIKVKVEDMSDFEFVEGSAPAEVSKFVTAAPAVVESDDEAMNRIATRFQVLDEMSKAAINGDIRAMIVSGPPGVGKSFGVETQLEKASLFDKIAGKRVRYEVVKGAMTALGLYAQLYKYSDNSNMGTKFHAVHDVKSSSL
jgi:hypothetical protein